ncbi:YncE family protein, partial [Bacillus pumilus]|uniref:YncE family protein n=2 Tax=Bacillus TaxID=1386 RepID=UPI0036F474C0
TNKIYVASNNDTTVFVIDGVLNIVIDVFFIFLFPAGIAVNTITNQIYVTNSVGKIVSVVDGFTNKVVAEIMVGETPF